jgi:hypothetical protein
MKIAIIYLIRQERKMKKILLITIGLTTLLLADFSRDATSGVVTDSITGLQWDDNTTTAPKTWQAAITYCEDLELPAGVTDWRLPNINELTSIVDDTTATPSIDGNFTNTDTNPLTNYYWSSTTTADNDVNAWRVRFDYGNHEFDAKTGSWNVRCVRGE